MTGRWRRWLIRRRLDLTVYWRSRADLDEAARHADAALRLAGSMPAPVRADVLIRLAHIERDRDRPRVAAGILEQALGLLEPAEPSATRDRVLVAALAAAGDLHRRAGRYPEAQRLLEQALRLAEDRGEPGPLTTVLTLHGIVAKELGAYQVAARHYARVLEVHRVAGASSADAASMAHNLAGLAHAEGRYADAEHHARRAVSLRRRQPVETAEDLAVLAAALAGQGRLDEAAELLDRAMRTCREAVPPRRYELAVQTHSLASIDQSTGRTVTAEARYREALRLKEELLGPQHPEVALVLHNLATLLRAEGRTAQAALCWSRALPIMTATYPADHPTVQTVRTAAAGS